jgi:hypothetical protein
MARFIYTVAISRASDRHRRTKPVINRQNKCFASLFPKFNRLRNYAITHPLWNAKRYFYELKSFYN